MLTFVSSVIPSVDIGWAFLIRSWSIYIFYCNVSSEKGVALASINLHLLVWGCWEHLDFSEETSLEPDLLLLPTESKHINFISAALQIAFQVVGLVKVLFSWGLGTLSFWRGHLHFITWEGLSVKSSHSCWRQTHIPGIWHHNGSLKKGNSVICQPRTYFSPGFPQIFMRPQAGIRKHNTIRRCSSVF